ncbi:ScpA family protein [Aquifex aeolicus]|uniref:Uncharacterized protein aq_aa10 n=1 Tax=Aquifex aeolicus (strain VF5) TaxID=224324 RepID=YZ10_AQUAE|nr:ScpA family protein [Aquifex aeolicus]O66404.1 RecName: Full=Uncharacterized protein aq_aa10 [Aquifex aeolicus VF5]AAC07956.1 putative protein [Aquifex aeolicus VF5]
MNKLLESPYDIVLEEVREGKVNPFDVDLDHLIALFRKKAKELKGSEYMLEAGKFLEASSKLLLLKLEYFFPKSQKERKKVSLKEVQEVLIEEGEEDLSRFDTSFLWEYSPEVGRPKSSKGEKPKILEWREFWKLSKERVPLHREPNWQEEAKRVYEEIKRGVFRIRNLRDFIAFLFAYMEYEEVQKEELLRRLL